MYDTDQFRNSAPKKDKKKNYQESDCDILESSTLPLMGQLSINH